MLNTARFQVLLAKPRSAGAEPNEGTGLGLGLRVGGFEAVGQ